MNFYEGCAKKFVTKEDFLATDNKIKGCVILYFISYQFIG